MSSTPRDWRRDRKSRKRSVDDDAPQEGGWSPPQSTYETRAPQRRVFEPASAGPEVGATVKRFDTERGFGFVVLDGGGGDAFLHISALQRVGADAVSPGTRLKIRVGPSERGQQVTEVVEIGSVEMGPEQERRGQPTRSQSPDGLGEDIRGIVKWYSAEKGFGFVTPESGDRDVFVHATALERGGISSLTVGQAVTLRVADGKKGPEAVSVSAV